MIINVFAPDSRQIIGVLAWAPTPGYWRISAHDPGNPQRLLATWTMSRQACPTLGAAIDACLAKMAAAATT